jgi:Dullard-like phosphatase family protein
MIMTTGFPTEKSIISLTAKHGSSDLRNSMVASDLTLDKTGSKLPISSEHCCEEGRGITAVTVRTGNDETMVQDSLLFNRFFGMFSRCWRGNEVSSRAVSGRELILKKDCSQPNAGLNCGSSGNTLMTQSSISGVVVDSKAIAHEVQPFSFPDGHRLSDVTNDRVEIIDDETSSYATPDKKVPVLSGRNLLMQPCVPHESDRQQASNCADVSVAVRFATGNDYEDCAHISGNQCSDTDCSGRGMGARIPSAVAAPKNDGNLMPFTSCDEKHPSPAGHLDFAFFGNYTWDKSTDSSSTSGYGPDNDEDEDNESTSAISSRPVTNDWRLLPPLTPTRRGNSANGSGEQRQQRNCLVLDLDETLVHASFEAVPNADFVIPIEMAGVVQDVYVLKRPHVDEFLARVSVLFETVLFTASLAKYAEPVARRLDPDRAGIFSALLSRDHCAYDRTNGYVKDLSQLGRDLRRVIIVDNSPLSYAWQPDNALEIETWVGKPDDTQLLQLMVHLEILATTDNVLPTLHWIRNGCLPGNMSITRYPPESMTAANIGYPPSQASCGPAATESFPVSSSTQAEVVHTTTTTVTKPSSPPKISLHSAAPVPYDASSCSALSAPAKNRPSVYTGTTYSHSNEVLLQDIIWSHSVASAAQASRGSQTKSVQISPPVAEIAKLAV